jgi:uncharacterized membrane protein
MKQAIKFTIIAFLIFAVLVCAIVWSLPGFIGLVIVLVTLGFYDLFQKKHTILRNFPVICHMRYLLEMIGPELHQYFVESCTDERHDMGAKKLQINGQSYHCSTFQNSKRTSGNR